MAEVEKIRDGNSRNNYYVSGFLVSPCEQLFYYGERGDA
jgi:hypothetical protein